MYNIKKKEGKDKVGTNSATKEMQVEQKSQFVEDLQKLIYRNENMQISGTYTNHTIVIFIYNLWQGVQSPKKVVRHWVHVSMRCLLKPAACHSEHILAFLLCWHEVWEREWNIFSNYFSPAKRALHTAYWSECFSPELRQNLYYQGNSLALWYQTPGIKTCLFAQGYGFQIYGYFGLSGTGLLANTRINNLTFFEAPWNCLLDKYFHSP